MSQYRTGKFTSAGTAVTLALGFVPDRISIYNLTNFVEQSEVIESIWMKNTISLPSGYAIIWTATAGAPVESVITTNGVTPVILGGDWQSTQYTITTISKANPGVVTVSGISPTNTLTLVNGMTITISSVVGMTQVNTNRYIVSNLTIVGGGPTYTFTLYDLFGNPVDTTAFGTYVSGGIVNQISYPPTAPVLDSTTGQVITPGQPAGNQYDIGYEGVILGTGVVGDSADEIWWEAITMTPTGW